MQSNDFRRGGQGRPLYEGIHKLSSESKGGHRHAVSMRDTEAEGAINTKLPGGHQHGACKDQTKVQCGWEGARKGQSGSGQ